MVNTVPLCPFDKRGLLEERLALSQRCCPKSPWLLIGSGGIWHILWFGHFCRVCLISQLRFLCRTTLFDLVIFMQIRGWKDVLHSERPMPYISCGNQFKGALKPQWRRLLTRHFLKINTVEKSWRKDWWLSADHDPDTLSFFIKSSLQLYKEGITTDRLWMGYAWSNPWMEIPGEICILPAWQPAWHRLAPPPTSLSVSLAPQTFLQVLDFALPPSSRALWDPLCFQAYVEHL